MHFTCQKMHSTVRASLAGILLVRTEVNLQMGAGEWNFTPLIIAQLLPQRCESQSKQYYCYFSNFWDIPTVFCNQPKILPQRMQTEMQTALILIGLFLFRPVLFAQKNCKVAVNEKL